MDFVFKQANVELIVTIMVLVSVYAIQDIIKQPTDLVWLVHHVLLQALRMLKEYAFVMQV
jgi:hypothetical protein